MQFFGGGSSLTSVAPDATPAPAAPPGTGTGANAQVLYVFNRGGVCLLYREWHRPLRTLDPTQDQKLMFGLLFSLRSFTSKIDPTTAEKGNLGVPLLPGQGCSFYSFKTNTYKLNFLESPSGIKLILITHPRTGDQRDTLKHIYNLYVEYVVKNPLYAPGTPIKCELFNKHLDQYVKTLI
ncbi:trafficking protein particle complex subunit 1 isoform X2 [Oryza brachyantha]|uniref:trafficking protein particle complex subunit 1 isoform X2 n=1 Tax=Oryza brachyantha TaxID=4533 RepID=UPI001ADA9402|nr:trafficking protein particle complex subunit 1 isoform X2 [Oryza brachyantha]